MEEPNAFALPGGPVYVSRALLVLTNSEDELAGVLGHEIGHVAARHAVRRVTRAAPLAVVTGLGAAVTSIVSPMLGDLVGGIGGVAGASVLARYSREQEPEADRIGQELAAAAGWDPAGLSRSLRTLERDDTLHHGEERPNSFFATHPPLPDRVADTEARAATLARTAAAPVAGPGGMLRRLDGLPVGPRASNGVFDGETFLHPDLDFRVRFPAGWKTANERTVVGASAPDGRAVVGLELVGKGSDPEAALRAFQEEAKIDLAPGAERLMVGGLPAIHATTTARTSDGRVALDPTWIRHAVCRTSPRAVLPDPPLALQSAAAPETLRRGRGKSRISAGKIGQYVRGRRDRTFSEKRNCYAALRTKWRAAVRRVRLPSAPLDLSLSSDVPRPCATVDRFAK